MFTEEFKNSFLESCFQETALLHSSATGRYTRSGAELCLLRVKSATHTTHKYARVHHDRQWLLVCSSMVSARITSVTSDQQLRGRTLRRTSTTRSADPRWAVNRQTGSKKHRESPFRTSAMLMYVECAVRPRSFGTVRAVGETLPLSGNLNFKKKSCYTVRAKIKQTPTLLLISALPLAVRLVAESPSVVTSVAPSPARLHSWLSMGFTALPTAVRL